MHSIRFRLLRAAIASLLMFAVAGLANAQGDFDNNPDFIDGPPPELATTTVHPPPQPKHPLSSAFLDWGDGQSLVGDAEDRLFERNRGDHVRIRDPSQGDPCSGKDGDPGPNPAHSNPIVLSTGNKVEPEVDFDSAGEMPLRLVRTYDHNWSYIGVFGMYWVSNLDYTITIAQDESTVYAQRPDGRRIRFTRDPGNSNRWWEDRDPGNPLANITRSGTGNTAIYVFMTEDNYVEYYDYEGRITQRYNTNGVSWTFAYTNRVLSSVTRVSGRGDGSGRTMTLLWIGNNLWVIGPDGTSTNVYAFDTTALDGALRLDSAQLSGDTGSPLTTVSYLYEDAQLPGALTGKSYNGTRYSTFAYDDASGRATVSKHAGATAGTYVDVYQYSYTGSLSNPPPGGPSDPPPPGVPCDPVTHQCPAVPGPPTGPGVNTPASLEKALIRMIPDSTNSVTETNPLGYVTTYTFVDGQLTDTSSTASAHCGARVSHRTYDIYGYDDVITDFNGNRTDYNYLPTGQLQQMVEGSGSTVARTTSYTWEPHTYNRPLTKTVSGLNKTTYTYGTFTNRIQSVTVDNLAPYGNADSHVWNYTYTLWSGIAGIVKTMTVDGPLSGDTVTTTYDEDGDLLTVTLPTSPASVTTYSGYNAWGEPTRVVGANGAITDYVYYPRGKLKSVTTYPDGVTAATTTYTYASELLSTVTTPDGVTTSFTYDNARRLWTTSRPEMAGTAKRTLTYDVSSNVIQVDENLGITLKRRATFQYDELDRVRTRSGMNSQSYTYTYDNSGNLKTAKDSYLKTTTYSYDSLNRVSSWTGPMSSSGAFTYDAADLLKTVTDPHGVTTSYQRDGFGQLWQEISPDRGTTKYAWHSDGTLDTMTRGYQSSQPVQTTYLFDPIGRLKTVTAGGQSETFAYDTCTNGIGRLCTATAPSTTVNYTYEDDARVRTRQDKITLAGVLSTYTTSYGYDTVGRLSKLTYPNNEYAIYSYTTGQPSSLTMTIAGVTKTIASTVSFEPFGPLSGYTHTNGLIRDYTFDLDGRYNTISSKNGSAFLQSLSFVYDHDDRVTSISNSLPSYSKAYGYDDLSHLTSATNAVLPLNLGYSDDNNGNRLTMDPNSSVYTYNAGTNRVATVSNTFIEPDGATGPGSSAPDVASNSTFGYDGAGNVNEWDFSSGGVHATYAYDGFNRLASVSNTYQGSITYGQYGYNAFGERTNKRDLRNGNDYSFIYGEGHQLLADREDGLWTNYLWFAGELVSMTRGGAVYDIDSDNLGRPELVTNGSKAIVWQANNDPFGGGDVTPTNAIAFYIGFPGQYFDNDTNYWYNVNRYYVDALGRYLQPDPIGLARGLNPYAYVTDDPSNRIDPLGLWSFSLEAYAGFGGGFIVGRDPTTNQWFYGGRLGYGVGGGGSFDYQGKRPGADGPDCDHGTTVGVFIQAGGSYGPYEWTPVDAHGGYDFGKGHGYSEGPEGGNLTFGSGGRFELSGAFGVEVIGH